MTTEKIFKHLPKLETKRLILRPLKLTDADEMFEYASRPEVTQYTIWDFHRSVKETKKFLAFAVSRMKKGLPVSWAISHKKDKKMIGTAGIEEFNGQDKCATLGYAISPYYWNQGLTTEAVIKIVEFAFKELDANRVEAYCDVENKASAKVLVKAGMKYEGILRKSIVTFSGKVRDSKMHAIVKGDQLVKAEKGEKGKVAPKKEIKGGQAELFKL